MISGAVRDIRARDGSSLSSRTAEMSPKGIVGGSRLSTAASSIVGSTPRGAVERPGTGGSSARGMDARSRWRLDDKISKGTSTMVDFEVSVMSGCEVSHMKASPSPSASGTSSDGGESDTHSVSSRGSSKHGSRSGSRAHHLSVGECCIDIDQHDKSKLHTSLLTDFRQLAGEGRHEVGMLRRLQMYGFETPNKLQQHLIPVALNFLGKQLGGQCIQSSSASKGKSCIVIQGPPHSGKTSAVLLAVLAAIDHSVQQPQAVFLSRSSKRDVDKYLRVFALTQTINYQSFHAEDSPDQGNAADEAGSPEIKAAHTAHILIGHPDRILKVLSSNSSISLDAVKAIIVDDAQELFHGSAVVPSSQGTQPTSGMRLVGLPSGDKSFAAGVIETEPTSMFTSPIEEVVQICKAIDGQQYSHHLHQIIISELVVDTPAKKMMKLLKSSMMAKQNLLSVEPLPAKVMKLIKHYYAKASHSEWVAIFCGLVNTLAFPRALVYCDNDKISHYLQEMQQMGIAVSANLPGASSEARQKALQDFSSNKTQFLLTHSEPAICQIMLPKVSCVFHFGIPSHMAPVYGIRLLPLDEKLAKESVSIFLVDTHKGSREIAVPPAVSKLEKRFGISFMDMPLEFFSSSPPPRSARK